MQTIDDAWAALRTGNRREAEVVASQLAESAGSNHGADTPGHANALGELAAVLVASGDLQGAIAALRRAAAVEGVDAPSAQAQLSHVRNLGELLLASGQTDEAVRVLQSGLDQRRRFFGEGHPGVGYGLLPLADAELAQGILEEAAAHVAEAVAIFRRHAHPELAMARIVGAEVRERTDARPFVDAELDPLTDTEIRDLAHAALERADRTRDPVRAIRVLEGVRQQVLRRFGPRDAVHEGLLAALANLAGLVGDHSTRIQALTSLQALLDAFGTPERAHEVTLGLALATSEADRPLETEAHYQDALTRLADLPGPASAELRSSTLRNFGLWLVDVGRADEGESLLLAATDVADPLLRGQAHTALGITLCHRGEPSRAEEELLLARDLLPAGHRDVLPVERHLAALRAGRSCGCGTGFEGIGEALLAIVRDDLPEGLLDRLVFDEHGQLQVHLLRQASDDEVAELWRVLRLGLARLRQGVRNRR